MSNTAKKEAPKAVAIYGTAQQIEQYGERLKHVLPGGDKLAPLDAVIAADYAKALDANIFRGEIYAYNSKGKLVLVESYKLLVRWARRQSDFFDSEEELTAEELESLGLDPVEDIGYRVWILREDKLPALEKLALLHKALGDPEPYKTAKQEVAQHGVGIVTKRDRTTRDGKPQDPPVGWTWHDVAKKRALKNAINKAYGIPSPREIADESWRVGDVQTTAQDWQLVDEELPEGTKEERERLAAMQALERERAAAAEAMTPEEQAEKLEQNSDALGRPPEDFEGFDTPPTPPPEPDQEEPEPLLVPEAYPLEEQSEVVAVPRDGLTPEVIRRTCRYHGGWKKGKDPDWSDAFRPDPPPSDPISEGLLTNVAAALNNAIKKGTEKEKADKRHAVYRYLYDMSSGKALTMKEGQAILLWIGLPDAQKVGEIKAMAPTEVQAVVKAAEVAAGQQVMDLGV